MKIKIILLLVLVSLCSFSIYHKFYVSVTEIEYNQEEKSLQIITRVFVDDFENLLKKRYNPDIRLGKSTETPKVTGYIEKYLDQKMAISLDGKPMTLNYLGKEYENDMILFYIEAPDVSDFQQIKVNNTVLMDLYEEQKNLIHVEFKGSTKSVILAEGKEEYLLNFNH